MRRPWRAKVSSIVLALACVMNACKDRTPVALVNSESSTNANAEQSNAEQSNAEQSNAEQSNAEQSNTEQSKTEQANVEAAAPIKWLDEVEAMGPVSVNQPHEDWRIEAECARLGDIVGLLGDVHTWHDKQWVDGRPNLEPDQLVVWFRFFPANGGRLNTVVVRFLDGPAKGVVARVCPKGWASARELKVHALLVVPDQVAIAQGPCAFEMVRFWAQ